MYIDMRARN